jgi:predicted DNA-binding antitoxin AbrB/MazE fold protein
MQIISVKYEDGVFVPVEPLHLDRDSDAVVVISDEKPYTSEEHVKMYQDEARSYFQEKFPGMEISKDILELVGILRQPPGKYDREAYREYLWRKHQ